MKHATHSLKQSYYDYATKLPAGLPVLLRLLQQQQYESLFNNLANLAEGLEALHLIEQALRKEGEQATGRLEEAIVILEEMLPLIEAQAVEQLQQPLTKLCAVFSSATEWTFVKQ